MARIIDSRDHVRAQSNRLYGQVAGIYPAWLRLGSLGAFPRLYLAACAALELAGGETVLDMCCGTGELMTYLQPVVTPAGSIVGCDLSAAMLVQARRRCARAGWDNVELVESDALSFRPTRPLDAAIFSICLSAIPWRIDVLDHVIALLPPGAPVVIIDSLSIPGHPFSNAYNRVKGRMIGADPDCGLRAAVAERLTGMVERRAAGAVYSLLAGRTR